MQLTSKLKQYVELTIQAFCLNHGEDILPAFITNVFNDHVSVNSQILTQELDQRIENLNEFIKNKGAA